MVFNMLLESAYKTVVNFPLEVYMPVSTDVKKVGISRNGKTYFII